MPGAAARGGHRSAAGCGPGRGSYRSRAAAPSAGPGEDPWLAESGLPLRSEPLGRVAALAQSWRVRRARGPPPGALCGGDGAGRTGLRWVEVAPRLLRTAPRTPTRCRGRIPNAARCDLPPVPSFSCATLLPSRLIYPRESAVPIATNAHRCAGGAALPLHAGLRASAAASGCSAWSWLGLPNANLAL